MMDWRDEAEVEEPSELEFPLLYILVFFPAFSSVYHTTDVYMLFLTVQGHHSG